MEMISQTVVLQALVYGLLNGSIYALMSIGFTMIFGVMGIVNFAYGQLTVVSMYVTLLLYNAFGLDPFLAMAGDGPPLLRPGPSLLRFRHPVDAEDPPITSR